MGGWPFPLVSMTPTLHRSVLFVFVALAAFVATSSPVGAHLPEPDPDEVVFTLTGGGWGHGVGMSQYGALGRAEVGHTHEEILAFYYHGTSLETDDSLVDDDVDVLISIDSATTFEPTGSVTLAVDGGDVGSTAGPEITITRLSDGWQINDGGGAWCAGNCIGAILTISFVDGEPVDVSSGRRYAHGQLQLTPAGGGITKCGSSTANDYCVVVGDMTMQHYLYGLAEVPASWHAEALASQAIAGRSYAQSRMNDRADWGEPFDLYDSTTDQAYTGWDKESELHPATPWPDAVDATDDKVITYDDSVIAAFYSSSNGGYTAASEEPWVTPLPYLLAKPDRYDAALDDDGDPQNPNAEWEHTYTADLISDWLADYPFADLDVGQIERIIIEDEGPSGRVDDALVTLVGSERTIEVRDSDGDPYGYRFYWALVTGCNNTTGCHRLLTTNFFISSFLDVPATAYFAQPVSWMVSNNLTTGVKPNYFAPDDENTRAQLATFMWRFADKPPTILPGPFIDVVVGSYYETPVAWMAQSDITTGTTPTTFEPEETVTRAQAATFLWRYAGEPESSVENPFDDVEPGRFYTEAVLWMVEHEITTGTTPTTFDPEEPITRGQIATFLWRLAGAPDAFAPDVTLPSSMRD